jgi:hypothetical protein
VIVAGYLGLLLLIGVTAALLVFAAGRVPARTRLFLRCLRWGFATGAVAGAVVGALVVLLGAIKGDPWTPWDVILGGGVTGTIVGGVVALIPTLIGATYITDLLGRRQPHPVSEDGVQRDLTPVMRAVVAVLDLIVVVALIAGGAAGVSLSSLGLSLGLALAGNAAVILMLGRARTSIGRLWSAAGQ